MISLSPESANACRRSALRPRVLVLDDEEGIRTLVANDLEMEGFAVTAVGTIAEAEQAAQTASFDVYILDVMVPDGNGMNFARDIRRSSDAGIILLTGRGEETDRVVGLEIGADDYVVKPFRPRELRARVNAVHRRTRLAAPRAATPVAAEANGTSSHVQTSEDPVVTFHGLQMREASRTVLAASDEVVDLTTLEFDVLRVLLRNRNRVLSRDQIMDQVKGQDWAAYDRAVDGLISRLRQKLYPDGSGVHRIKTIRGVGYMLAL